MIIKKMPQVEKSWMVVLFNDGYRWLARDNDNSLYACVNKPYYDNGKLILKDCYKILKLDSKLFPIMEDYSFYEIHCNASSDYFYLEETI